MPRILTALMLVVVTSCGLFEGEKGDKGDPGDSGKPTPPIPDFDDKLKCTASFEYGVNRTHEVYFDASRINAKQIMCNLKSCLNMCYQNLCQKSF